MNVDIFLDWVQECQICKDVNDRKKFEEIDEHESLMLCLKLFMFMIFRKKLVKVYNMLHHVSMV